MNWFSQADWNRQPVKMVPERGLWRAIVCSQARVCPVMDLLLALESTAEISIGVMDKVMGEKTNEKMEMRLHV
jgi:hypothetical protein